MGQIMRGCVKWYPIYLNYLFLNGTGAALLPGVKQDLSQGQDSSPDSALPIT